MAVSKQSFFSKEEIQVHLRSRRNFTKGFIGKNVTAGHAFNSPENVNVCYKSVVRKCQKKKN